jgi:hypothetical protein
MKTFTVVVYTRNRRYGYGTTNNISVAFQYLIEALIDNPKSRVLIEL